MTAPRAYHGPAFSRMNIDHSTSAIGRFEHVELIVESRGGRVISIRDELLLLLLLLLLLESKLTLHWSHTSNCGCRNPLFCYLMRDFGLDLELDLGLDLILGLGLGLDLALEPRP